MKKIKFNYLAIIGMVVAMATVAFTAGTENALIEEQWYFDGPTQSSSELNKASNYVLFDADVHTDCDNGDEKLCTIMAPESSTIGEPLLDPQIEVTLTEPTYSPITKSE